jgi:anti-anti-sigma factor
MVQANISIDEKKTEYGVVVSFVGELDLTTVLYAEKALTEAVALDNDQPVIADLLAVNFIDSAGLALLIRVHKRLAAKGRSLRILMAQGKQPERVLKLVRFDAIMKLGHSIEDLLDENSDELKGS